MADTIDDQLEKFIAENFEATITKPLSDFIRIPNLSRLYDKEYLTNGLLEKACQFVIDWSKTQGIEGLTIELLKEEGRTPAILAIVDQKDAPTVLMYGHIDKQPHMTEKWRKGLHPTEPVIENGRLYGRGGADDGYAFFACIYIVKALQKFACQKHRFVFFFECDEESGSADLMFYLDKVAQKIGEPKLIICLDSGTVDYDHLSLTTTLRGAVGFSLTVTTHTEGVHSGMGSGILPDTFRIARQVIDKFEDPVTGRLPDGLYANIPKDKYIQACDLIGELGKLDYKFPFLEGVDPISKDPLVQYINRNLGPTCTLTGFSGVPTPDKAGNVLHPSTTYVFSVRLPPTLKHEIAVEVIENFFKNLKVPFNADLKVAIKGAGTGLNVPAYSPQLQAAIHEAAMKFYKKVPLYVGEGGSIPFLCDLQKKYKDAEMLIAGVLGPESNAHGPNEFIHLKYTENLIQSFVRIFRRL